MKRVHVKKGFHLIILEKIVDSIVNYSQLSSRLHTSENIGPLWRRKYYVIPPQGLRNITSSIEAQTIDL